MHSTGAVSGAKTRELGVSIEFIISGIGWEVVSWYEVKKFQR